MGVPFDGLMNELPENWRSSTIAEADRLEAEYLTLQMLCKAKKLVQADLPDILNVRQATVSNMEKRSDLPL